MTPEALDLYDLFALEIDHFSLIQLPNMIGCIVDEFSPTMFKIHTYPPQHYSVLFHGKVRILFMDILSVALWL
ncbi:hypothetical protein DAPPUDRAFT_311600 [Daphnia pulex]|uniref:Uncharacterized protein n=1 Tax=Daphnia pulex TaxID=6669 RepID=E9FXD1_DAPPU|nr:hypothetical protein DAPPUDRAFT_311600 [Daphnia pulex]|eukprot:EFX88059.1 hypothetical protein DAPPUDRAFT_311600 [Daphnia pulex]